MTSRLDDRIREMMQQVVDESPPPPDLPSGPPPVPVRGRRVPNWAVAVGAAVAVFILIGGVVWLIGGTGPDSVHEPMATTTVATSQPPTTTTPVASTEAARATGVAFDPTVHDLCDWFTPDEIRSFVADAYQAEGITYPIPEALVKESSYNASEYAFADWGCSWRAAGAIESENLRTFDLTFSGMSEDVADNEEPIYRPPADSGAGDLLRDGIVVLDPFDAPNIHVTTRDQRLLVGHIPAVPVDAVDGSEFDAWIQTALSSWLNSTERQRVQVRILNAMLEHMNWIPRTNN